MVLTCIFFAMLHWACSKADEVKCPPGFGLCGPSCVSLVDDASNCGACGHACGTGQACSAGSCRLDCFASLRAPIRDRWGTAWDSLERPPATLANATAACTAIGGRLPTATEIHRVAWGGGNADVGQSYQVNDLWTLVPRDRANQFTVKMSNGAASANATGSALAYRCLCPAASPATFSAAACNGPPGQECFALTGPNAGYNMDAQDRAALTLGGAMWECGFARAQLPRFLAYAEAILEGLPNGTLNWLHTSDLVRYDSTSVVRWKDTQPSWSASANSSYDVDTAQYAFRCTGRAAAPTVPAVGPVDAFVGVTGVAADSSERAAAGWASSFDDCWAAGGHLPYSSEVGALIQQGLGNGTKTVSWTAEQEGYNGVQFLAGYVAWGNDPGGTDVRFGEFHPDFVSWAYRIDAGYGHRCVYYPVDPKYVPPADTVCAGGCDAFPLSGSSGAKLWMDKQDRAQATLISAIGICRGIGAHLATERDYTETIRKGLGNGSSAFLHAVDLSRGEFAPLMSMIVHWSNVDRAYDDQWTTYSTWEALDDVRPYRCMWTNEIR
ncbi:MAG TPA: hypothetical protein VIV57_02685 [Anaeromyxobacter sp.]